MDLEYLAFLENMLTENRKERFEQVLAHRSNHFTVVIEDVFQLHNTSAVMRSCEVFGIQQLNVIEERYTKSIDKEMVTYINQCLSNIDYVEGVDYSQVLRVRRQVQNRYKSGSNYNGSMDWYGRKP